MVTNLVKLKSDLPRLGGRNSLLMLKAAENRELPHKFISR
jgi:hypothetical protein